MGYPTNFHPKAPAVVVAPSGIATPFFGSTLSSAFSFASAGDTIILGPDNFTVGSTLNIKANQTIVCNGTTLTQSGSNVTMLQGSAVDGWSILGKLNLVGEGNTGGATSGSSVGLDVNDCVDVRLQGVVASGIRGVAFNFVGPHSRNDDFKAVDAINCQATHCYRGIYAVASAEYHSFVNSRFTNCNRAVYLIGGNWSFANCRADENTIALYFDTGSNAVHGTWTGGSINHNTSYGIACANFTLGYRFANVEIYADGTTDNLVYMDACSGVAIDHCYLWSSVTLNGTLPGKNFIRNCEVNTSNCVLTATAAQRAKLICTGNWTYAGAPWSKNDAIAHEAMQQQVFS